MLTVVSLRNPIRQQLIIERFREIMAKGQYSEGRNIVQCETLMQELYWEDVAVAVANGGAALYIIARYLKENGHTKVAIQNNTFFATGAMFAENEFQITLIDSRIDCPNMSYESLVSAWEDGVAFTAVVVTHTGGWLTKDIKEISDFCMEKDILLIEDCAHSYGMTHLFSSWTKVFSFSSTTSLPAGEGGMILTQDFALRDWARRFRQYGKSSNGRFVEHTKGMNLRMSEWDAAVLVVQLQHWSQILEARCRDARKLQSIAPCLLSDQTNWYKYPVGVEDAHGLQRVGGMYAYTDQLKQSLECYGVHEQRHVPLNNSAYWGMHHVCLPIGEGLYDGLTTTNEIKEVLKEKK